MDVREAERIVTKYYDKTILDESAFFEVTEALNFLIEVENDPYCMITLGGFYSANRNWALAYKYYEMARKLDYKWAYYCIAEMTLKGTFDTISDHPDEKTAFQYLITAYKSEKEKDDDNKNVFYYQSGYIIACLYKQGRCVKQNIHKYHYMIEELYCEVTAAAEKDTVYCDYPLPDIYYELSEIRISEGKKEEAARLLITAKNYIAKRHTYNTAEGCLENSLMQKIVLKLYSLIKFGDIDVELYDLYYVFQQPANVYLKLKGKAYNVISTKQVGKTAIYFENKWYSSPIDFFYNAKIGEKYLMELYDELYDFEVKQ